ncbi:hypothetical protein N9100_02400 [Gammaproteobacteria bacterium]|nr:hypothetical protein [Gammaproteobacteria bacterium]
MNINEAYPGRFIKAVDLKGQFKVINITSVAIEEVGKGEMKPVLHWTGSEQGFVLNKTNSMMIASFLGNETTDWVGKEIELYPTRTQMGADIVDCIRVREPGTADLITV